MNSTRAVYLIDGFFHTILRENRRAALERCGCIVFWWLWQKKSLYNLNSCFLPFLFHPCHQLPEWNYSWQKIIKNPIYILLTTSFWLHFEKRQFFCETWLLILVPSSCSNMWFLTQLLQILSQVASINLSV